MTGPELAFSFAAKRRFRMLTVRIHCASVAMRATKTMIQRIGPPMAPCHTVKMVGWRELGSNAPLEPLTAIMPADSREIFALLGMPMASEPTWLAMPAQDRRIDHIFSSSPILGSFFILLLLLLIIFSQSLFQLLEELLRVCWAEKSSSRFFWPDLAIWSEFAAD